jgi:hypothetical protein
MLSIQFSLYDSIRRDFLSRRGLSYFKSRAFSSEIKSFFNWDIF